MNLNIRQANATKSYVVTDVCTTRPRIAIKAGNNVSYLPLTTSAKQGFGLRNKVNGVNYRPLEYQSMSTSATYYTTAVASNGLSSTTALTRSSTSQTVYHTCSSTSGTSYLTRSSTSATSYLTISVSKYMSFSGGASYANIDPNMVGNFISFTRYSYNNITSLSFQTVNVYNKPYYVAHVRADSFAIRFTEYNNTRTTSYNQTVSVTSITTFMCNSASGLQTYTTRYGYEEYRFSESRIDDSYGNVSLTFHSYDYAHDGYYNMSTKRRYYETFVGNTQTSTASTTGTSYLTRSSTSATSYLTRSSTSRTEYKTRASTSGYSGVSSSSSQSSGWL